MIESWRHVVIVGANGAIGGALAREVARQCPGVLLDLLSRTPARAMPPGARALPVDILQADALEAAVRQVDEAGKVDAVLIAVGLLHDEALQPEKSLRALTVEAMLKIYEANCIGPAMVIRAFLPLLPRDRPAVIAALSARVGSISDNRLGGWTSYRAAKAALNMVIRNAAIEAARRCPQAVVVGLHPGTVDSRLSAPFQSGIRPGGLFAPETAAARLLAVIDGLTPGMSGRLFAHDGREILP